MTKVENVKYAFSEELIFLPKKDLHLGSTPQEISQLKSIGLHCHWLTLSFCYVND